MLEIILYALLLVICAYGLFCLTIGFVQERLIFPGRRLNSSHQFIDLPGLEEKWVKVEGKVRRPFS